MDLNRQKIYIWSAIFLIVFIVGCRVESDPNFSDKQFALPSATTVPTAILLPTATPIINEVALIDEFGRDFAEKRVIEVYEEVSPAVVNITTQILRRTFFFQVVPESGAGSGFVIDKDGHILTNHHVIAGAQTIEVTFSDDTTLPAELIGSDPANDIAVLKVSQDSELLHPIKWGSSVNLQVGQRAIAIGNPFGRFGSTLTVGVVSAVNRTLQTEDGLEMVGIIQTDAAINRGNSGGPLLDSSGSVVGMNSAIFSPSGTNAGVGFAIPAETIQRVLPDLLAFGRYRHPSLRIRYTYELNPNLAAALEIPIDSGLLLVELYADSPLLIEGVNGAKEEIVIGNRRFYVGGDIITDVGDHSIQTLQQLKQILDTEYQVGDLVTITIIQDGKEREIEIQLVEE